MTAESATITHASHLAHWLRERPRVVDAGLVLLAAAGPVAGLAVTRDGAFLLQALAAVPIWWRRRAPLVVLSVVSAIAALAQLVPTGPVATGPALAIVVFTVASLRSTARAILGYGVAVGLPTLLSGTRALVVENPFSPSLLDPLLLMGLAMGFAVRASRERRRAIAALVEQRSEQAVHAERIRIAAEMHDVVAQSLTVMVALAGGARTAWERHPERAQHALEQLGEVGGTALEEMQRILQMLRTERSRQDGGLRGSGYDLPSLDELVQTFRTADLPVVLHHQGPPRSTDPALDTTVHRIVQEALTNALRYASGATEVRVDVTAHDDGLLVTVSDDGRTDGQAPSIGAGSGLIGIRTRAESFGGASAAGPRVGGGWEVRVVLPHAQKELHDAG